MGAFLLSVVGLRVRGQVSFARWMLLVLSAHLSVQGLQLSSAALPQSSTLSLSLSPGGNSHFIHSEPGLQIQVCFSRGYHPVQ